MGEGVCASVGEGMGREVGEGVGALVGSGVGSSVDSGVGAAVEVSITFPYRFLTTDFAQSPGAHVTIIPPLASARDTLRAFS